MQQLIHFKHLVTFDQRQRLILVSLLFSTYQGFVDKEARFTTGQIDNQSQSGSTSGEIVIDGDVTVSSATTFTSGLKFTVTDTFTLPSGDTNSRETDPTPGSLRFNQDFATLEFYTGTIGTGKYIY